MCKITALLSYGQIFYVFLLVSLFLFTLYHLIQPRIVLEHYFPSVPSLHDEVASAIWCARGKMGYWI